MRKGISRVLVSNKECLRSLQNKQIHYYCIHEDSLANATAKGFVQHGGFTCTHDGKKHRYFYVTPHTYGTLHCSCGHMELVRDLLIPFQPPSEEVLSLNAGISLLQHAPYAPRCSVCKEEPSDFQLN